MAATTNTHEMKKKEMMIGLGLRTQHSYSIMRAVTVKDKNGKLTNLVKLRNLWSNFEWVGKWGDSSDAWTEELKQELGLVVAEDGIFWMEFEEMKYYFETIQICKYKDGNRYSFTQLHQGLRNYTLTRF